MFSGFAGAEVPVRRAMQHIVTAPGRIESMSDPSDGRVQARRGVDLDRCWDPRPSSRVRQRVGKCQIANRVKLRVRASIARVPGFVDGA